MIVSNDVVHDTRVVREARTLRAAGHEVSFLGWDRSGGLPPFEKWDGFPIHRIRTRGSLRLLPNDVVRNPVWWRLATKVGRSFDFDVIHCHDLDALPIGVRLKVSTGRPLVYDAHEVFGYMIERDVPPFVVRYAFRMEARLAPEADRVIAVNEKVKEYVDRIAHEPAVIVRNVPETALDTYRPPPAGRFTILYVGTLHRSRFLLPAIDVVASMPDVRLVIGGGKALAGEIAARCARHPNTRYLGVVPADQVLPMTVEANVVLSMFDPGFRINQIGLPNKIFEAMAAGRPSIVADGMLMADLVRKEECGVVVPYTEKGFREAVGRLRDDPALAERLGRNGLEAAKRAYNWTSESKKLLDLYASLTPAG
jgi:glycosyltransferase involved in cell wall biosynthesis